MILKSNYILHVYYLINRNRKYRSAFRPASFSERKENPLRFHLDKEKACYYHDLCLNWVKVNS